MDISAIRFGLIYKPVGKTKRYRTSKDFTPNEGHSFLTTTLARGVRKREIPRGKKRREWQGKPQENPNRVGLHMAITPAPKAAKDLSLLLATGKKDAQRLRDAGKDPKALRKIYQEAIPIPVTGYAPKAYENTAGHAEILIVDCIPETYGYVPELLRFFKEAPSFNINSPTCGNGRDLLRGGHSSGYTPLMTLVDNQSMNLETKLGLLKQIDPNKIDFAFPCKADGPDKGKSVLDFECAIKEPDLLFGLMECLSRKKNPSPAETRLIFGDLAQNITSPAWDRLGELIKTGRTNGPIILQDPPALRMSDLQFNRLMTVILKAPVLNRPPVIEADMLNFREGRSFRRQEHPYAYLWNELFLDRMSPESFRLFVKHPYFQNSMDFIAAENRRCGISGTPLEHDYEPEMLIRVIQEMREEFNC